MSRAKGQKDSYPRQRLGGTPKVDKPAAQAAVVGAELPVPDPSALPTPRQQARANVVTIDMLRTLAADLRACKPESVIVAERSSEWAMKPKQVWDAIKMIYAEWSKMATESRAYAREKMRDAFRQFIQEARALGDTRSTAMILDRLAKLEGVYEPEKIQLDVGGVFKNPGDAQSRLAELLTKPELAAKLAEMLAAKQGG